jgi:hypothetical protein
MHTGPYGQAVNDAPATTPAPHGLKTEAGFLGQVRTEHRYNATAVSSDEAGRDYGWELVQVGDDDRIYRSNGISCFESGTRRFHDHWTRARAGRSRVRVVRDGGRAYRAQIARALGPVAAKYLRAGRGR